jgi:hypothetical protein
MDTELEFQNSILIKIRADRADTGDIVIEYVLKNKVFVFVSQRTAIAGGNWSGARRLCDIDKSNWGLDTAEYLIAPSNELFHNDNVILGTFSREVTKANIMAVRWDRWSSVLMYLARLLPCIWKPSML